MPPATWKEVSVIAPSTVRVNGHYYGHMAKTVNATTAKANILRLLDEAASGEEIEITRHGRPVARLLPPVSGRSLKGSFAGRARTAASDEDLLSTGEMWESFQ
jgi:prevent-host-death family protein